MIKNLIVKAVTAPFALLGSLFAGAEEAQFVDFAPGEAALDPATAERLDALAKSLAERPELKLDVPIGAVAEIDRPALAERAYQSALAGALASRKSKDAQPDAPAPTFETLEPHQRIAVLTALVTQQTGAEPTLPEPTEPPEGTSREEAKALREAAALEFLEQAARASVVVPDSALAQLGEERATSIEKALLGGGALEPTRVFKVREGKVSAQDGHGSLRARAAVGDGSGGGFGRCMRAVYLSGSSAPTRISTTRAPCPTRSIPRPHEPFLRRARHQPPLPVEDAPEGEPARARARSGSRARRAASRPRAPAGGTTCAWSMLASVTSPER